MSLQISMQDVSKKFNQNWIFKDISIEINAADKVAFLGANGSGKSTLMQIVSGYVSPTSGNLKYTQNNIEISKDVIYSKLSIAAPSTELIEEFTLEENVDFYSKLKPLMNNISAKDLADFCYLNKELHKPVQHFSSGMKQRLKLALAILSDVPLLLLDEPTSNLDAKGIDWYKNLVKENTLQKTCIICSNQMNDEYFICNKSISIDNYKNF